MDNSYKTMITIPRMEEIVEEYRKRTPFREYDNYDFANSYKYLGAKMVRNGEEYYFASKNLAIFFFTVHGDIQQDERNEIIERFTSGYKSGYAEIETAIADKLGLQERSHDNVQTIVCKTYAELYKKYNRWLYSAIYKFDEVGYNQGQLHKLKVMMQGLDEVEARNESFQKASSDNYPVPLLKLQSNECRYLYTELTKDGYFLPKDTKQAHFNYIFGGGLCPKDFTPLCWNRSKQALSELIIFIVGKKSVPNQIKGNADRVFLNNEGLPIGRLSNPKKDEYSSDYEALENITKALKSH